MLLKADLDAEFPVTTSVIYWQISFKKALLLFPSTETVVDISV